MCSLVFLLKMNIDLVVVVFFFFFLSNECYSKFLIIF